MRLSWDCASTVASMGSRGSRSAVGYGAVEPPGVGRRLTILLVVRDNQIGDIENEIAGAPITDQELMPRTEPIEHGKTGAIERDTQSLRGLPAVGMGDEEIALPRLRAVLEI